MKNLTAVIEIGSTGIRLLVAQITADGAPEIIDRSEQPVTIGRDVFTQGEVSQATILVCLKILRRYAEQLAAYGIAPEETAVIATSSVREAANRDPVVDRIRVKTGFTVRVIDGIEENRLMYLAVMGCFKGCPKNLKPEYSIIMEVSGGSTELMLIKEGRVAAAHSLRLGTVVIEQQLNPMMNTREDARRYIDEFIRNTESSLNYELDLSKVEQFIIVGAEANIAAREAGRKVTGALWKIHREDFERFILGIENFSAEMLAVKLQIAYNEADGLYLALLIFRQFLRLTKVQHIIVPRTSIREGLFISRSSENAEIRREFDEQVAASAWTLLRKYRGDEKHAEYVRKTSLRIFDMLKDEIGLESGARRMLEVSAILHDVGMFIRASDHEAHSQYIILHSEIFGLNKEEITLIAHIASYHRGSRRPQNDSSYKSFQRSDRLAILKLAAILRVADALDRGHQQKIRDFTASFSEDSMTIRTGELENIMLEKIALQDKGDLFESVFGYKIVLV
ncbi:MAG: HD domain-containing protein [Spirochaetaceae bacterium]|nr:HD domain-containing protein [Spirochaetaceae bacterium]